MTQHDAFDALDRTVQEIQALSIIYNDETYEEEDESNATKFTILSLEEFQNAKQIVDALESDTDTPNDFSATVSTPVTPVTATTGTPTATTTPAITPTATPSIALRVEINVELTSADGIKFQANVDITLPPHYPDSAAIISSATITDLDMNSQQDEFSKAMNEKSKELAGSEILVEMISFTQDYAAEYVANHGHERVDQNWNRPNYFTSYTIPQVSKERDESEEYESDSGKGGGGGGGGAGSTAVAGAGGAAGGIGNSQVSKKPKPRAKARPRSRSKSSFHKNAKPVKKKNQTKSKSFEQRLDDLRQFKEEYGHCTVPYTYDKNQPLSNWCSNIRYSYGLVERGLTPTIKMTKERIDSLREVGFDFSGLKTQTKKKEESSDAASEEEDLISKKVVGRRAGRR